MPFYAYILTCADASRYYGSTSNLLQRLARHRRGAVRSTTWRLPIQLVYFEEFPTLEQARRRERSFKYGGARRKTIDRLIAAFPPHRLAPFA
jgi:predicted GIY-YIG superfamily endonuclease